MKQVLLFVLTILIIFSCADARAQSLTGYIQAKKPVQEQLAGEGWSLADDLLYYKSGEDAVSRFAFEPNQSDFTREGRGFSYYLSGDVAEGGVLSFFVEDMRSDNALVDVTDQAMNSVEPAAGVRLKFNLGK